MLAYQANCRRKKYNINDNVFCGLSLVLSMSTVISASCNWTVVDCQTQSGTMSCCGNLSEFNTHSHH